MAKYLFWRLRNASPTLTTTLHPPQLLLVTFGTIRAATRQSPKAILD
jgi:hypothetical protein